MDYIFLIVIIVVMFGMMFWQSKKAKQQQAERQDFRANLQPGTEVITIGGVIGKVVSNTRRSSSIPKALRFVSASTPSAANTCVLRTYTTMRSMKTVILFPPIPQTKIRLLRSRLKAKSKRRRLRPSRRTADKLIKASAKISFLRFSPILFLTETYNAKCRSTTKEGQYSHGIVGYYRFRS